MLGQLGHAEQRRMAGLADRAREPGLAVGRCRDHRPWHLRVRRHLPARRQLRADPRRVRRCIRRRRWPESVECPGERRSGAEGGPVARDDPERPRLLPAAARAGTRCQGPLLLGEAPPSANRSANAESSSCCFWVRWMWPRRSLHEKPDTARGVYGSSSLAISSSESSRSSAASASRRCPRRLAPTMGAVTTSWWSNQARATWAK